MDTPSILIVDDEPENLKALERTLRSKYRVVSVQDPVTALETLDQDTFATIISDYKMPQMLGTEFLAEAGKKQPLASRLLLTAYTETAMLLEAINRAEIYRYVTKPWDNAELLGVVAQAVERHQLRSENRRLIRDLEAANRELESKVAARTAELEEANEQLARLAMTDPLTKIWNRRAFFSRLQEEVERTSRYSHPLAVAMIDVDHFKKFNDEEGHVRGDEALRRVAAVLQANLRKSDLLGRFGGEEFILLMPETNPIHAVDICERLRVAIEKTEFQGREFTIFLTISIGVANFPDQGTTAQELVEVADQALYEAKAGGRNRVVFP